MEAGEFPCGQGLIYMLRLEFLAVSHQMYDGKYIHGTFLKYYQHLDSLRSPVVTMEAGEFPHVRELIYVLRLEFLAVLSGTNDEKYIHGTFL
jgi:hypothetical protein